MAIIEKKAYPNENNYQNSNAVRVPLQWAISYLQDIQKGIPTAERDTANVVNWNQLAVVWTHTQTDNEIRDSHIAALIKVLRDAANADGITADKAAAILAALGY